MFWNKPSNHKNMIFLIVAILLILFIAQIKNIALLGFGAFVLACSLNPAVDKLSKVTSRSFASTVVIISTVLIIIMFLGCFCGTTQRSSPATGTTASSKCSPSNRHAVHTHRIWYF